MTENQQALKEEYENIPIVSLGTLVIGTIYTRANDVALYQLLKRKPTYCMVVQINASKESIGKPEKLPYSDQVKPISDDYFTRYNVERKIFATEFMRVMDNASGKISAMQDYIKRDCMKENKEDNLRKFDEDIAKIEERNQ